MSKVSLCKEDRVNRNSVLFDLTQLMMIIIIRNDKYNNTNMVMRMKVERE